jgi:hypothetical protein
MPKGGISLDKAEEVEAAILGSASIAEAARKLGIRDDTIRKYRRMAEDRLERSIQRTQGVPRTSGEINEIGSYQVVIFSDAHFWPDSATPAYHILLTVLEDLEPEYVVDLGDSFDGASLSRFPASSWQTLPTVREEYEACRGYLDEIRSITPGSQFLRVVGNHDLRLESYLAQKAPAMMGMPGMTISELFPDWDHKYSFILNGHTYLKHRWHGGTHAAYNNTLKSGQNIVTGHLHKLICRPYRDLNGTRFGIEAGTLADPSGPQFEYTENNPLDWHQGFVVLTVDGEDLYPEMVEVRGNHAYFRGKKYVG